MTAAGMTARNLRRIALVGAAALVWSLVVAVVRAPAAGAAPAAPAPATGALPRGDLTVRNGDFESGTIGWTASCTGAFGVTTDQHSTGTSAGFLRSTAACAAPSATGTAVPATPKMRYTAFVDALAGGGTVRANLVFLDAAHRVLARGPQAHTGANAWTTLQPTGVAPAAARYVSVQLSASTGGTGTAYFDNVRISRQFTDLGQQLSNIYARAVTFGKDRLGQDVAYVVTDGAKSAPAHLVVVDVNRGTVQRSFPLNTGSPAGSWSAVTATNGIIYVASFQPGALWAYKPGGPAPRKVATLRGNQIPFALTAAPGGRVYIGGYPDGVVYKYTPGQKLVSFVSAKKLTGQDYVRSLAVDMANRTVFVGVGTRAGVLACGEIGAKCTNILPAAYRGQQFAYQISATTGRAFVLLSPSNTLLVLDVTRQPDGSYRSTVRSTIPNVAYPGATQDLGGTVYYRTTGGQLFGYDLATGTSTALASSYPGARASASIALKDQKTYPGATILSVGTITGGVVIAGYNVQTGAVLRKNVTGLPGAPVAIQYIQRGPDEKIYSGGYLVGGLASYTPMRSGSTTSYSGVAQTESMATLGDTLYLGIYPNAVISAYRPDQPVASGANPKTVCTLSGQQQDRPYAMVAGGGKLYIGTMATYGQLQGALTVYDPATGTCAVHKNLLRNQSIVSLAYSGGVVYAGSLVWGGLGVRPAVAHARLLIFDTKTGASRTVPLPVGSASLEGLTVGPDGNIWMMAQGTLLIFSPKQGKFVSQRKLFGDLSYPKPPLRSTSRITAYDAFLTTGADGKVYGTVHGRYFFRLDSHTKQPTVLYRGAVTGLTSDSYGNLYFIKGGDSLVRYVP